MSAVNVAREFAALHASIAERLPNGWSLWLSLTSVGADSHWSAVASRGDDSVYQTGTDPSELARGLLGGIERGEFVPRKVAA